MIKTGFKYRASYIKDMETRAGSITEFQIGDKVKDTEVDGKSKYWNVRCTVWNGIKLQDGDTVIIDSIQSIEAREYNGKTYHDMTITCHVDGVQAPVPAKRSAEDDDIRLPFSLDIDP
jgi:hypothetical protein